MPTDNEPYNLKLLYVEDDANTREPMVRFLRRRFAKVIQAHGGRDGLTKFEAYDPDIIITDLAMEDMDGLEMVAAIRHSGANVPILITSALQEPNTIVKTVDMGIIKYIIKPIILDELADALAKIADGLTATLPASLALEPEQIKEMEGKAKTILAHILKSATGKGPQNINVYIGNQRIEVVCHHALTPFELTLLQDHRNIGLVEQSRLLLYRILGPQIQEQLSLELGIALKPPQVQVDVQHYRDTLSFFSQE